MYSPMSVNCVDNHFLLRTMCSFTDQESISLKLKIIQFDFTICVVYLYQIIMNRYVVLLIYLSIFSYCIFHKLRLHFLLFSGLDYLDLLISAKMTKTFEEGRNKSVWRCLDCGKEYKLKGDTSRHVEAHHIEHPGLECNLCGRILKTRESLRGHVNQSHKRTTCI